MTSVQFLGACGNQTADRETVSFVVSAGDGNLLVDTGPAVVRQLARAGIGCAHVSDVLVTHAHGDHTAGFAYFVWSIFYETLQGAQAPEALTVSGLPEVIAGLRASLEFAYDPSRFPFEVHYRELAPDGRSSFEVGSMRVTTIPVDHAVPTVGARFDTDTESVTYSADTLYSDTLVKLARGSRLLIHEGFVTEELADLSSRTRHATARMAGRAAAAAGVDELALVHFYPPLADRLDDLVTEAEAEFDGRVFVPTDLQRLDY